MGSRCLDAEQLLGCVVTRVGRPVVGEEQRCARRRRGAYWASASGAAAVSAGAGAGTTAETLAQRHRVLLMGVLLRYTTPHGFFFNILTIHF